MAIYRVSLFMLAAVHISSAVQCPPSHVFDEIFPLHPSSCSAITLCIAGDGSAHLPTFDTAHLPCLSTLIALQCPKFKAADAECEYSILQFDDNGSTTRACCDTFDLLFEASDLAPQNRLLRHDFFDMDSATTDVELDEPINSDEVEIDEEDMAKFEHDIDTQEDESENEYDEEGEEEDEEEEEEEEEAEQNQDL
ncbi:hypothetical protein P175DRAFT_0488878 [Aspergillus ochraceoroseus IBT 24754]|uniref:Uncharacterized protein n=1 Tax=Aspergillus ochraceoroseus IBT 24754 TaxID=1392256 RepID=A0A2T5M559_9EURO|nr:uncharacterized protein P175DRAFT_0488878 [Aspergillus ochraceoroseus IBT 24754]PTU23673.1 hypothetical protein P175DRAFT_0488878 [Aspergillus ochraceoroseus IBT 24754]